MGRIINGIKHICVFNDVSLRNRSLEDNVYFTVRDIFFNCNSPDDCMRSCEYNSELSGNIMYEDRTDFFEYTDMLHEECGIKRILSWFERFTPEYFEFIDGEKEIMEEGYIVFDDWWASFNELKRMLREEYVKIMILDVRSEDLF